jgi:hypothetical protein
MAKASKAAPRKKTAEPAKGGETPAPLVAPAPGATKETPQEPSKEAPAKEAPKKQEAPKKEARVLNVAEKLTAAGFKEQTTGGEEVKGSDYRKGFLSLEKAKPKTIFTKGK